ncbi:VWA domain-containing protein [Halobacterium sp. R2-5]|uniref:VWA domain-containing protein n=1 Tax=Halobacterium sp. R2-5 TaxID=2715751 RepID=UPI001FB911B1|nr:VWA domain-containing protein [Halobacterium sp. R2-5]
MAKIAGDTVGGFNSFLDDQRSEPGTATVSLYDFDTGVERVYHGYPIEDAPELDTETYSPSGQTALYDAISMAIAGAEDYLSKLDADASPENVIVVVLTDGKENASETPQRRVREQVTERREEYGWEFLFIGANQDAALTATSMGMDADNSLDMAHSSKGTQAAYESTSERISEARREGSTGGFDDDNRERQDQA